MAYLDEMNVKANEQDTVGTDYDLRDKDLNAATAKTSVASTDGVVLKGTDGSYHTIDRSSFTEAVRSVIGGILNNMASKGTAVKGVSVIDNSNDFGLTTPSDLASVLGAGVVKQKNFISLNGYLGNAELDIIYYESDSTSQSAIQDWPADVTRSAETTVLTFGNSSYKTQIFINSAQVVYWRFYGYSTGWSAWSKIIG